MPRGRGRCPSSANTVAQTAHRGNRRRAAVIDDDEEEEVDSDDMEYTEDAIDNMILEFSGD